MDSHRFSRRLADPMQSQMRPGRAFPYITVHGFQSACKGKGPDTAEVTSRKKTKDGGLNTSNFKTDSDHDQKHGMLALDWHIDQWNEIEGPERNHDIYDHLICDLRDETFIRGKDSFVFCFVFFFSQKMVLKQSDIQKKGLHLIPYAEVN